MLAFELQDPEPDSVLWDPVFDLWDLVLHPQISKHSPFIDLRRQRRINTWSQNKESALLNGSRHFLFYHLWQRCKWVEEIYRTQIETPIILLQMKFGLHNTMLPLFKGRYIYIPQTVI